jgi:hypothetical protein
MVERGGGRAMREEPFALPSARKGGVEGVREEEEKLKEEEAEEEGYG